jgi:hypothetical protein
MRGYPAKGVALLASNIRSYPTKPYAEPDGQPSPLELARRPALLLATNASSSSRDSEDTIHNAHQPSLQSSFTSAAMRAVCLSSSPIPLQRLRPALGDRRLQVRLGEVTGGSSGAPRPSLAASADAPSATSGTPKAYASSAASGAATPDRPPPADVQHWPNPRDPRPPASWHRQRPQPEGLNRAFPPLSGPPSRPGATQPGDRSLIGTAPRTPARPSPPRSRPGRPGRPRGGAGRVGGGEGWPERLREALRSTVPCRQKAAPAFCCLYSYILAQSAELPEPLRDRRHPERTRGFHAERT